MFAQLSQKFHTFPAHHQIFIAVSVAALIIIASWAIEKILEEFLPPKMVSYMAAFLLSLIALWVIKHFILHVW